MECNAISVLWFWTQNKRKHLKVLILLEVVMTTSLYGNTKQGKLLIYTLSISQPNGGNFNICECASDRIGVCVFVRS